MTSAERRQLAKDLSAALVARYPGEVLLAGVYGSTARGTDTAWSDLEMVFVLHDGSNVESNHFIYRDIPVGYQAIERAKLEDLLARPTMESGLRWPFWMGVLSVLEVLYGDAGLIDGWLQMGQSMPLQKFHELLEALLPQLISESYGRILSCRERQNTLDIGPAVWEVLFEMNLALCLLNRRWVTHDYYQGFVDAFDFPKLPAGYSDLVPTLWSATTIDEIVPLAETLVNNFWQLLADEGIQPTNYQSVEDVPL